MERKRPTLLVFYCPCHKHLFQVRQIVRFSWKLQDKWWNNFNEISTHLTTHHNQTHLKLFRTQWTLIRPAETWSSLIVGLIKIDYNIREIMLLPVKCLKRIKKLFYLFHLYVSSLFVLTSFPLSLLLQNSVPSGKTVPKNARKLYKALKVYIYSENNKSFNIRVSPGKPKPLNKKTDCVFYHPLRITYIQTNWTILLQSK